MSEAATINPGDNNAQVQDNQLEPLEVVTVDAKNVGEVAKALWARVQGEKFDDKAEVLGNLFTALRKERDANKTTRKPKTMDEIISSIKDQGIGKLQAVKVPIMGISLSIPQVVKLLEADPEKNPMAKPANDFFKKHKLKVVEEKAGSRGKKTKFIRASDYKPPEVEAPKAA